MPKKSAKKRSLRTKRQSPSVDANQNGNAQPCGDGRVRIIGGEFRGRTIRYSGDPLTRPMKHNTREALFNLVGGWTPGKHVFDLFAGTGAIALEALSRGAVAASLIERHFPTSKIIAENVAELAVGDRVAIDTSDAFFWCRQFFRADSDHKHPTEPWLVFVCPPYQLFVDQADELLWAIDKFLEHAPVESILVVESDERFDVSTLPKPVNRHDFSDDAGWRTRLYPPAQVSIWHDKRPRPIGGGEGPIEAI